MTSNIGGEIEFLSKIPRAVYDHFVNQWDRSVTWLYGEDADGWTEKDQRKFEFFQTNPVMKYLMDSELDKRATREYMQRYGLSWSDVHDPRKVRSSNFSAFSHTLNFVSDNVKRLY